MKRFLCVLLVFVLCMPSLTAFSMPPKQFYVETTRQDDGTYCANICFSGAEEADELSAIRLQFSYPEEAFVCKSNRIGAALRQFPIRVGAQYTTSNPVIFVGVQIEKPVTEPGIIGTFILQPKPGAVGELRLDLTLIEALRLDNTPCEDEYVVRGASITLDADREDPCVENGHSVGPWEPDAHNGGRFFRLCTVCGVECEEKFSDEIVHQDVTQGDVSLSVGDNLLPDDVHLEINEGSELPEEALLGEMVDTGRVNAEDFLGSLSTELIWQGEQLVLHSEGNLTVPAPQGVENGESVYVISVDEYGVREAHVISVKEGALTFPTRVFGTLYYFKTTQLPEPENTPIENGPTEPSLSPETQPTEEEKPAVEKGSPWIFVACGVVLAGAVVTLLILVGRRKKNAAQVQACPPVEKTDGEE